MISYSLIGLILAISFAISGLASANGGATAVALRAAKEKEQQHQEQLQKHAQQICTQFWDLSAQGIPSATRSKQELLGPAHLFTQAMANLPWDIYHHIKQIGCLRDLATDVLPPVVVVSGVISKDQIKTWNPQSLELVLLTERSFGLTTQESIHLGFWIGDGAQRSFISLGGFSSPSRLDDSTREYQQVYSSIVGSSLLRILTFNKNAI